MKLLKHNKKLESETTIANNIRRLMIEVGVSESQLARQTNIPQTTLNRLLTKGMDARTKTLLPIAQFFKISVSQLIGEVPIDYAAIEYKASPDSTSTREQVPIVAWQDICFWDFIKRSVIPYESFVVTEKKVSASAFACVINNNLEPLFVAGSTLIIDPELKPQNGNLVLVHTLEQEPQLYQVELNKAHISLIQPLTKSKIMLGEQDKIIGVILESRLCVS